MKRTAIDNGCIGIVTVLMLCLSSFYGSVLAQNKNTINGMVYDSQHAPVTQIPVELMNEFNSVIQRVKTDGAGRFFFSALSNGRYSIRVLPLGTNFEEQTKEIEIGAMGAGGRQLSDNAQVDFQLLVRRSSNNLVEIKGVIFAQDIPTNARKLYETAISDIDANRLEAGATGLENAIKIFPTYYLALTRLGIAYIGQQKYEKATDVLTKAVAVNDRSFAGWYGLSYADFALNKVPESIVAAQKALELDKTSVNTLFLLGVSQRRVKNYEAAEKSLIQAKKIDNGKSPDINWNLALLYAHNLNRYNDAANELEIYLKINPNVPNKDLIKKLIKQFREKQPSD